MNGYPPIGLHAGAESGSATAAPVNGPIPQAAYVLAPLGTSIIASVATITTTEIFGASADPTMTRKRKPKRRLRGFG